MPKKVILGATVIILLLLSILLIFNCCVYKSTREQENYFMTNDIQQKFSEIRNDGISPAVLLIHGFGGSPMDVKPLTDVLKKRGYAFHAIVLPGHGTTPRDLKDIKKDDWLEKTSSAYESLKQRYHDVSVVGFSMGGAIGLFIAAEKDVSKLVLISPYFRVKERWFYFGKPEIWAQRLTKIVPFVKKPKIGQINDPHGLKRYISYRSIPTKSVGQLSKIGRLAKEKGKKVTCETLWIHSKSDVVADFQVSREVFETIPAKKKYFIEYDKSNHVILYDYDHVHVIDKITSFLKGDFNEQSIENN